MHLLSTQLLFKKKHQVVLKPATVTVKCRSICKHEKVQKTFCCLDLSGVWCSALCIFGTVLSHLQSSLVKDEDARNTVMVNGITQLGFLLSCISTTPQQAFLYNGLR